MEDHIELFRSEDARTLLTNKYVLFIGDSVIRAMYKDMIKILQTNDLLKEHQLKTKGEYKFENDDLLEGGQKGIMSNETTYTEIRQFQDDQHLVKFYFITRCYSDYLMSICDDLKRDSIKPDVVIMNSGCWDLTRYGQYSRRDYRRNLPMGIYSLLQVLPESTLFIWTTTLPLSKEVRGGFMLPELEQSMQSRLRHDVLDGNFYASLIMKDFNVDLVDMHYYFKNLIQHRKPDGIHWDVIAHRRVTNILLNHISECWDFRIPYQAEFKRRVEHDAENFVDDEYVDYYYDDYGGNDYDYNMMGDMNMMHQPIGANMMSMPLMPMPSHLPQNGMMPFPMHQPLMGGQGNGGGMMVPTPVQFMNQMMQFMNPEPQASHNMNRDLEMVHSHLMSQAAQRHVNRNGQMAPAPLMSYNDRGSR